jgi:hypothetical protein
MYNTLDLPSLDNVTHVFYARLCIFIPIAIITFVIGTYMLIKLTKRVTYNVKKEIRTSEYKKRLAEKHKKWQVYFNSVDNGYYVINNRELYDSNDVLIGYIID